MITDKKNYKVQTPDVAGNWLWTESGDGTRLFSQYVAMPLDAPEWQECTAEEKEAWEKEQSNKSDESDLSDKLEEAI